MYFVVLMSLWLQKKLTYLMMKEDDQLKKVGAVLAKEKSMMPKCFPGKSDVVLMMQISLMNETICMIRRNQKTSPWLINNKKRKKRVTQMLKAMQHQRSFHKKNIYLNNALKSLRRKKEG